MKLQSTLAALGLGLVLSCARPAPPAPALVAPKVEKPPEPSGGVDRTRLPEPGQLKTWTPPTPRRSALKNGIKVWHLERGSTPLVSLLAVIPKGSATDPKAKAGTAYLMADLLDEGAGTLGALQLSDELQRLATDYSSGVDVDYVMLAMDLLAENYGRSVELLADIMRRPRFEAAEFKRRKDYFVAAAISNESQPQAARSLAMLDVLFGDGYGGSVSQGTRSSLERIGLNDVKAQYRRLIVPDGLEFVVIGGIEQTAATEALERAFGDWAGKSSALEADVGGKTAAAALHLVDFPGAPQTVFSVVRRAPGAQSDSYFPAMVFNRGFGEAFTSRINLNLREDKGYAYGASSSFSRFRKIGYFAISSSVKTDVTRPSIDEVFSEISALCGKRPITPAERNEAVSGLLLGFPGRFETSGGMAQQFAGIVIYQRPVDWFDTWPAAVEAVDVPAANRVANENCDPNGYSIVLAGDRATIEPTLASLNRPLVLHDRQGKRIP
jgi:zinc protease